MLASHVDAAQAEGEDNDEQDFLFLLEEGYLQNAGETQVDAGVFREVGGGVGLGFFAEYGLTERLQVGIGVPFGFDHSEDDGGIGDLEFGLDIGLSEEEGAIPAVALELEGIAPIGAADQGNGGWGYGAGLSMSKILGKTVLHISGGLERTESLDLQEWWVGGTLARPLTDGILVIGEARWSTERESSGNDLERERQTELSFGSIVGVSSILDLGAAMQVVATGEDRGARLQLKMQAEW
jgi:hypothetical protein